jgi:S1-C subfamily serine protease
MTDETGTPWNGDPAAPEPAPSGPAPGTEPDMYAGYRQPPAWSPPAQPGAGTWPGAPGPSWTAWTAPGPTAPGPTAPGPTAPGPTASADPWPAPPAQSAGSVPEVPAERKHRRSALLIVAGVALVCAAGGGGAAIALSVAHPSAPGASTSSIPGATTSGGPVNVSAIAACVDPAVVDLHTDGGAGTGMVLTPDGTVLTNNHVVSGATEITGQIDGAGRTYRVDVLGVDPSADVALVRLEGASNLPVVHLGSSAHLVIGEQVVAIGNALNLAGPPTVTSGIISALDRSISASDPGTGTSENLSGLVQTQASINPGNSGGPLVDGRCQVIGMNTAAANGSSAQSASNIGFAIPIDTAAAIVHQVEAGQSSSAVMLGDRAYVGVAVFSVAQAESPNGLTGPTGNYTSPVPAGAVVANVVAGLPAEGAGVQPGDVIVSFDGSRVSSPADLERLIGLTRPYASARLGWVDISGVHHTSTITLAMVPVK